MELEKVHQHFAIDLNNKVWGLLENSNRTESENQSLIWAAYASLYHWSEIGQPVNIQRGEWMVSRVWAVLGCAEQAIYHAERCRELTEKLALTGFDLAYSWEAIARAYACVKPDMRQSDKALEYFNNAKIAGGKIEGEENIKLFFADLENGPWFGLIE